ncbi:MAG TPA: DUF512 domain-containing protein [Clostridiales bacterium]|jgi:putative radical SAM enzyme (TIGR03279 family)|nr:DUF512 domain-containing protein [Clostridiales bacterium]
MTVLREVCFLGAKIINVEKSSPAYKKAVPGDRLISINGNPIEDVLDYKYYSYERELTVVLESAEGKKKLILIRKDEGEDLGLEFDDYLMDRARTCANKCIFCFIDQLPPNVRKSLLFKDDDARMSFLLGNYITLTNLRERDIERIVKMRISPVNISVHTTNPELRVKMLRNKRGGEIMDIMRRFKEAGITMNCQIVCCPGINDRAELLKSLEDLRSLYPAVASVSVVPVGLTKHREGLYPLGPVDLKKAAEIIDMTDAFGDKCLKELGSRLFYCADELYLKAKREIPPEDYYEGYPQIENGVGLMRSLEEEFKIALENCPEASGAPFSIATGVAAAPFLTKILKIAKGKCVNINGRVYAIENDFFGKTVDVAGLVAGGDLISQLKGKDLGRRLLIPASMLRHGGDMFLDDVTLSDAEAALGVPIVPVPNNGYELLSAICDLK